MDHAHDHAHAPDCGHRRVAHGDHHDYLHDGHLHHVDGSQIAEHVLEVDGDHPADCTPDHVCAGHEADHAHGADCGHEAVPHGDHVGFLVEDHLHFPHGDHCDDHGQLAA
ncbi:hypothetical protein BH23ACT9_BH23ACT9_22610 [soil metagenome]